jgi:hypothetical protein
MSLVRWAKEKLSHWEFDALGHVSKKKVASGMFKERRIWEAHA